MLFDIGENKLVTFLIIPISKKKLYKTKELERQFNLSLVALTKNRECDLLFSGGIDSSVLFVLLKDICKFNPTHFLYEGRDSEDHKLINEFNLFFNTLIDD